MCAHVFYLQLIPGIRNCCFMIHIMSVLYTVVKYVHLVFCLLFWCTS